MAMRERGRATIQRILKAMTELLEQKLPESISVGEIAQRAGVSKATVHAHFGFHHYTTAKDGILRQLHDGRQS